MALPVDPASPDHPSPDHPSSDAGPRVTRLPAPRVHAAPPEPVTHPEELRASAELRLGPLTLTSTARATPAGLVAVGVMTGLILLGVAAVVRAGRG